MSVIGSGAKLDGNLNAQEPIEINGEFHGTINCRTQLIVGSTGHVDATLTAPRITIKGLVKGSVQAPRQLEILTGARFESDLAVQPEILIISNKVHFGEESGDQ